jgi:predicted AlkP superfamily phosphohydrolase/phosphomutase
MQNIDLRATSGVRVLSRGLRGALLATLIITAGAEARDRVIVLGFDGADAQLAEEWMDAGELPHLAELRDRGMYAPLLPTNPPQTPVSWSTFATGLDPGHTEIFDFLKRIPGTYLPDFALMTMEKDSFLAGEKNPWAAGGVLFLIGAGLFMGIPALLGARGRALVLAAVVGGVLFGSAGYWAGREFLPHEIPVPLNHRKGLPYWSYADQHGVTTRTIRVPATFPASEVPLGTFISGLGVPDMRGRVGTPSMYTSESIDPEAYNDFSVEVVAVPRRGSCDVDVFGPNNLPFYDFKIDAAEERARAAGKNPDLARQIEEDRLRKKGVPRVITLPLHLEITDDRVRVQIQDHDLTLEVGQWSDWLHLSFAYNPAMKANGLARFKLQALDPDVELYFSPVHFDPSGLPPFLHISYPHSFAEELAKEIGPYKTMGWSIDTWSMEEEHITYDTFLEDVDESIRHFKGMFDRFIEDDEVELYTQVFYFTDRVSHMLWHTRDPEHGRHTAEVAAAYGPAILASYKKMDEIVGIAMKELDENTHLIVLSDHGFATWRRAVNLNTWLAQNGFMTLTGQGAQQNLEALFDRGSFWPNVDWSRTQAFALGLGYIYVNVLGREPQGTVLPGEEYERVCREIAAGLEAFVDSTNGQKPVAKVYHRRDIYRDGFDEDLIPDLRVSNTPGYRVSWQSSLGNTPAEVLYTKEENWSGDHCSLDPEFVKGILYTSFPVDATDAWIADIFPTICELLEIPVPEGLHGSSLLPGSPATP